MRPRPLCWVGRSRDDLRQVPEQVRRNVGHALQFAQAGAKHPSAKPLRGFGGAGILEIVENHEGEAYRAVYTVRFPEAVYMLHAFRKKFKSATPRKEVELIRARLRRAEEEHGQFKHSKESDHET